MERRGRIATRPQRVDLVLHQRDQGRDNDVGALADLRWHLVAERLPAAGRKHDEGVPVLEPCLYGLELEGAEAVVAPVTLYDSRDAFFQGCCGWGVGGHRRESSTNLPRMGTIVLENSL